MGRKMLLINRQVAVTSASAAPTTVRSSPTSVSDILPVGATDAPPAAPPGTTQINILMNNLVNHLSISEQASIQEQVFARMLMGLAYAAQEDVSRFAARQIRVSPGTQQSLVESYVPEGAAAVAELQAQIRSPGSRIYANPDPRIRDLMSGIDPSFPIVGEEWDPISSGSNSSASSRETGGGAAAAESLSSAADTAYAAPTAVATASIGAPGAADGEAQRSVLPIAIAATVIPVVLIASAIIFFLLYRRKRKAKKAKEKPDDDPYAKPELDSSGLVKRAAEMEQASNASSSRLDSVTLYESEGSYEFAQELDGRPIYGEMSAGEAAKEMAGKERERDRKSRDHKSQFDFGFKGNRSSSIYSNGSR